MKVKSEDNPIKRYTSKLLLNSLYGRMGMNELTTKVRIMDEKEAGPYLKKVNWIEVINMGEKVMVKHSGLIDNSLLKIIDNEDQSQSDSEINTKKRGVPSSVPIAAAISSYARITLSQYLNIPNNDCVYADTDSVILAKPLDPALVGKGLGQLRLDYEIKEGIFISPKTYAVRVYSQGNIVEIFRAKGAGPSLMNYSIYQRLLAGENVVLNKDYFIPDLANGTVITLKRKFTIQGVPRSIKVDSGSPASSDSKKTSSSHSVSIIPYVAPNLALVPS